MLSARLSPGRARRGAGFTLVEILIVVSIISLLAGLVLVGVQRARLHASRAIAKATVGDWSNAIGRYVQDEGKYPAQGLEPDAERNDFPLLYKALCGERRPKGPGGRSAPYITPTEEQILVYDETLGEHRTATRAERFDNDVDKFVADPWGEPYVYRCNKGHSLADNPFMHKADFDLYSTGENGTDETMLGESGEDVDDIGNW